MPILISEEVPMKYALLIAALLVLGTSARAEDAKEHRHLDDSVIFDLAAEDWVTTKTAHVEADVEAAVSANGTATARGDMLKAVNDLAKGDWRLTSFARSQDQTGLERWSALFETRLPESELGGLSEQAKKLSKAGMQLSVVGIDFTPTLDEMETARSNLRGQIYKMANEQLTTLNGSLPGHSYRISLIDFTSDDQTEAPTPAPQVFHGFRAAGMAVPAPPQASAETANAPSIERAEKITLTARVILAALPEHGQVSSPTPSAK
jgi:hypothetical protein